MLEVLFDDFNLSKEIKKAVNLLGYTMPTKVQREVIPYGLQNKDLLVQSQTGSGKTAAFAIPICENIDWLENKPQALILTPTRELAIQVKEDFFHIGRLKRIKVSVLYGRASFDAQASELRQKTHIVVGTPGRVMDHILRGTLDLDNLKYLVLDEADEMLSMGFREQMEAILKAVPKKRVTMLFSATMEESIVELGKAHMNHPISIHIEPENVTVNQIEQKLYHVDEKDKFQLFKDITIHENPDSCIVFCNTKDQVDNLYYKLKKLTYPCDRIHGGMEQRDRVKVMNQFKQGEFRYLIATEVAARGIDVDGITHVINYEVPRLKENYIHRIGRTGRADQTGIAITLVDKKEEKRIGLIEEYIGREIPEGDLPNKEELQVKLEAFKLKLTNKPIPKKEKGVKVNSGITRIMINAGKKAKIRPVDIVGTICNIPGMNAEDIGIIQIKDNLSEVEVLNHKGQLVYQELQNKSLKGKVRKVRKV